MLVRSLVLDHSVGWLWATLFIGYLVTPLSWTAAAIAFWWLCQVKFSDQQASLMSKAFYGLALQASLTGILFLSEVAFYFSVGYVQWWYATTEIVSAAGALMTVSGFILLARSYSQRPALPHDTQ
jgi:Zn-dependent protease with chaperone function